MKKDVTVTLVLNNANDCEVTKVINAVNEVYRNVKHLSPTIDIEMRYTPKTLL